MGKEKNIFILAIIFNCITLFIELNFFLGWIDTIIGFPFVILAIVFSSINMENILGGKLNFHKFWGIGLFVLSLLIFLIPIIYIFWYISNYGLDLGF